MRAELERLVELQQDILDGEMGVGPLTPTMRNRCGVRHSIILALKDILTASDWIPVSERLPEREGWIWVVGLGGHIPRTVIYFEPGVYGAEDFEAWQPIEEPAPYRAEGGGG